MPKSFSDVPVIDVGALVGPSASPQAVQRVAEAIARACEDVGFFYIEAHGLSDELRTPMLTVARRFFALPLEDKMKLYIGRDPSRHAGGYVPLCGETTGGRKDWHEVLDIQPSVDPGGITRSPFERDTELLALPWLVEMASSAWDRLQPLAFQLAAGIAMGLGLPRDYFAEAIEYPIGVLRLAHYPAHPETLPPDVGEGIGAHTDYGMLTMVTQDEVGGLEVRNADGEWIPVPHRPGSMVVNIGKMMQRWSNDRFGATWHRVQIPRGRPRSSVSFFLEPGYDTVVAPLSACVDDEHPPRYEACRFGEIMAQRYQVSFGSYRKASVTS